MYKISTLKKVVYTAFAACSLLMGSAAFADAAKDASMIAQTVSFVKGGPTGSVPVAVVFNPGDAASKAHADEFVAALGGVSGKVTFAPKKVPVSSIGSVSQKVIFVAKGTSGSYSKIAGKAKSLGAVTVSNDNACLGKGCVVVVQSAPSVDIFISTALATSNNVEFASAFSMMITKK